MDNTKPWWFFHAEHAWLRSALPRPTGFILGLTLELSEYWCVMEQAWCDVEAEDNC